MMEDSNPVSTWDLPLPTQQIPSMWDDMLKHLLQDPEPEAVADGLVQSEEQQGLLGMVDSYFGDITGIDQIPNSETWWAAPVLDQIGLDDLCDNCIGDETLSLPGLSSEISSSPSSSLRVLEEPISVMGILDGAVSSPVSWNKAESSLRVLEEPNSILGILDGGVSSPVSCNELESSLLVLEKPKSVLGMLNGAVSSPVSCNKAESSLLVLEEPKSVLGILDGGVSSPVSWTKAESSLRVLEEPKSVVGILDGGVSSPVSCNKAEEECSPSSNSGDELGNGCSQLHSPIVTSCSDHGAACPDAGCDSSDVGALGRSCDNFAEQSTRLSDMTPTELDEDAKRQSRLMRNRESAVQSRLRKKSYVKELEAKCRAMENQMNMLHQTVAFTSAQNAALREELAHYRSVKGNGSKSGVTEPAALPSDSLPSESPSHPTTPFPSAKLELVAFLCHVLLLTLLLQVLPLKRATSEGKPPKGKARSERRQSPFPATKTDPCSDAVEQLRNRLCSSSGRRRQSFSSMKDSRLRRSLKRSMNSATLKPGHSVLENSSSSMKRRMSSRRRLKHLSRRSQYSSIA